MRPVAGRRVWKAGFGKFLFRHKVLHKMQMAVRSTRAETFWILPIYIQFRAGKRPAYWECVLTLRPNSLHLLHRPAGSLWAARSRNSYQVWRPHFQTWRCRSKTAETPERNAKREFIIERLKSIFVTSFLLEVWQDVCSQVCVYPVSVDYSHAARVGANPLLFDVVEHVNEQRAVHLVGQVDGRVALRKTHLKHRKDMNH